MEQNSLVRLPIFSWLQNCYRFSTYLEICLRYQGVISIFLRSQANMNKIITMKIQQEVMEMKETKLLSLMTWKRKHPKIFPYGVSIIPLLISSLMCLLPSTVFVVHLLVTHYVSIVFPITIAIQAILTQVSMLLCTFTDPGVIPQIVDKYEPNQQYFKIPSVYHRNWGEHKYLTCGPNISVYQKYCVECCIYRPIRTIHCSSCNHCIEKYDHHCPWLGVCVGKFNYKYFVLFVGVVAVLSIEATAITIYIVIDQTMKGTNFADYLVDLLVMVFAGIFSFPMAKLFTYHLYLISKGETTNEDLKNIYKVINSKVPYTSCYCVNRKPLVQQNKGLVLNVDDRFSHPTVINTISKGKRFSDLISNRQSVLKHLIEGQEVL